MSRLLLIVALLWIWGCSNAGVDATSMPSGKRVTQLFYGTDRNRGDPAKPSRFYGLKRGVVEYGIAQLLIQQSGGNATLEAVNPLAEENFLAQLRGAVRAAPQSSAMVFVHGYNRSYHQVVKQVAEFTEATQFGGVAIIWSWPSSRNPAGYLEDEANIRWSEPHLAAFLTDVISESGAQIIHLVGHSMGARGLTDVVLRYLLPGGIELGKIGEYVLLAPDIDAQIFKRDLGPQLVAAGLQTTLYTSANDKAMASAYSLRSYPRAGDSSYGPVIVAGMETIDATYANKSILGHSYFERSEAVGDDLAALLNDRRSAADRDNLEYVEEAGGGYWRLLAIP
jgi:esterase/lipase superfamily enzyme